MTLTNAYLALGGALLVAAALFVSAPSVPLIRHALRSFQRSLPVTLALIALTLLLLFNAIYKLTDADLNGFPHEYLCGGFAVIAVFALIFAPDLLGIRAIAATILLCSRVLLDAGFMHLPYSIPLATTSYVLVIFGLLWGAMPYYLRDWIEWFTDEERPLRARVAGGVIGAVALVNLVTIFILPTDGTTAS